MVRRWGLDASDPRWGDGHYYDYTGDCLDTRVYPRSKFVSEFGFQSYPSFNVLKNVTVAEDWSYTSSMMNYRYGFFSLPCNQGALPLSLAVVSSPDMFSSLHATAFRALCIARACLHSW